MPTTSTDPRAAAAALLVPGTTCHGFAVERCETVPELDADAYVLRHTASGARLLYLACDDENKAFAIGFKTPPADSTGVFHILEHSVLCGSAKFPVKEPFVDLIKSSMQTFLNAMTYPDKTIYPVATTNEQDLYNLMDVYLDAVFNPAIYTKPTIFEQEGWHYELDLPEGAEGEGGDSSASLREGTLRYNGVVFNEMKGALSDPMSVLDDAVNAALYPDTAYAHESGGDPRAIPALTYEQFLDTHARHYNPSNSYITLYGDLDVDRALAFLDERYLSQPSAASRRMDTAVAAGEDPSTLAPNPLGAQAPVTCEYKRVEMATTPENALVGLGLVLGSALDRKRTIAADILFEALLGSNEAPVKKAILAAGLGGNVVSYTAAESLQPYELIMLQNAQPGVARELRRTFQDACRDLCEHGVPRERLEAIISSNEYDLRQRDYGIADGVAIACDALSTWLYDDDAATLALKYGPVYEELRGELDGSYFEDLLRELVLENDHMALVELVPVDAAEGAEGAEAAELAAKRDAMTDAELADVVERTAALRAAQEAEDTPEAKATLPRLRVSDIGEAHPEPPLVVDTTAPIPCLRHGIPTNRLAYAMQYFDLSCVAFEDLPYVTLLCRLLKQLPTREHSAEELDNLLAGKLGFLSFTTEVMTQPDVDGVRPYLLVSAGALSEKIDALASLPREVWSSTLLADADADRMRDVLTQIRIGLEQGFINNGHSAALGRAMSYSSPSAVVREQLSGVDFYLFLRDLLEHFGERLDDLRAKLAELAGRIFVADGCMASFTGSDEDFDAYWDAAGDLGLGAGDGAGRDALAVPAPCDRHEAFVIPSDICFAARACDPRRLGIDVTGAWAVAANALSYDYLWNEIRVKGGAYGCGFRAAGERQTAFYTYRDPAIDPSIERVARAGEWLGSFEPDEAAFEGFIVSCVSGMDAPVKPYALTKRRNTTYLAGLDPHAREERRAQMLATTPAELRSLGADVTRIAAESPTCVFGGRDVIAKSNAGFNVVNLMG
ncbi:peptidase M16 [Collinsella aerofaciens]|uniref:insulinase family protein n=1 Tax=Collinsella aerofaciens TaxID=74426 RepID=UPI00136EDB3D|nr:insulinase family protein [Collinsella aerofaciens]MZJ61380.1 peptidase M16 [Collinsella aerofaciens]MZJ70639.1 peptidase M16 [Collinsella aerofaciens]